MRIGAITAGALAAVALTTVGCDKITANTFAVSVTTQTPALADVGNVNVDLSGILDPSALPSMTAAYVVVGQKSSMLSTDAPEPVSGATVSIGYVDGAGANQAFDLCEEPEGSGTYQTSSLTGAPCASAIAYVAGSDYATDVDTGTDTYSLSVTAPAPVAAADVTFDPAPVDSTSISGLQEHPLNADLTVSWAGSTDAAGKDVFLTVARMNFIGGSLDNPSQATNPDNWVADETFPLYSDMPQSPGDLLDMVTGTSKPTSATIPASVFSQEGLYLVVVTPTELDGGTSDNLTYGSGALAGAGTGFAFLVR